MKLLFCVILLSYCFGDPIYLRRAFPSVIEATGKQTYIVRSSFTNTTSTFTFKDGSEYLYI